MEWQPIETAPPGEYVLAWGPLWRHPFAARCEGFGSSFAWVDIPTVEATERRELATHWMPLPKAPE